MYFFKTDAVVLQVDIIHISASSKNAADDKIKQSLRRFADTHPPHTKVILISGRPQQPYYSWKQGDTAAHNEQWVAYLLRH